MKKIIAILFLVGFISSSFISEKSANYSYLIQNEGINFSGASFDEALKEAKKTGKLIFLDAYTDWCGPCKKMSLHIFTEPNVGKLYNSKFINLKMEMEKNPMGPELARKYSVRAYPSLLFIDGNGKLVKYVVGYLSADELIALGKSL